VEALLCPERGGGEAKGPLTAGSGGWEVVRPLQRPEAECPVHQWHQLSFTHHPFLGL
jgi:hypothetical protein